MNKDKSRSLDTETGSTGITALNIWDAQFRNNTGKVGTWSISLGEDWNKKHSFSNLGQYFYLVLFQSGPIRLPVIRFLVSFIWLL